MRETALLQALYRCILAYFSCVVIILQALLYSRSSPIGAFLVILGLGMSWRNLYTFLWGCGMAAAALSLRARKLWKRGSRLQKAVLCLSLVLVCACTLSPWLRGTRSSLRASTVMRLLRHMRRRRRRRIRRSRNMPYADEKFRGCTSKRGDNYFRRKGGVSSSFWVEGSQVKPKYLTKMEMMYEMHPHLGPRPEHEGSVEPANHHAYNREVFADDWLGFRHRRSMLSIAGRDG